MLGLVDWPERSVFAEQALLQQELQGEWMVEQRLAQVRERCSVSRLQRARPALHGSVQLGGQLVALQEAAYKVEGVSLQGHDERWLARQW